MQTAPHNTLGSIIYHYTVEWLNMTSPNEIFRNEKARYCQDTVGTLHTHVPLVSQNEKTKKIF